MVGLRCLLAYIDLHPGTDGESSLGSSRRRDRRSTRLHTAHSKTNDVAVVHVGWNMANISDIDHLGAALDILLIPRIPRKVETSHPFLFLEFDSTIVAKIHLDSLVESKKA